MEECGQRLKLWSGASTYIHEAPAILDGAKDEKRKEEDTQSGEAFFSAAKCW